MSKQSNIEAAIEITQIVRGTALSKDLFNQDRFVFEHKERIYRIGFIDDQVSVTKFTGLETETPKLIYNFSASYNKDAFEKIIKNLNRLFP